MTDHELLALIEELRSNEGDTSRIEAKAARADLPQRLYETLSSFSNAPGGGVIILGLDESQRFAVTGVKNPHKVQQDLASLCNDGMEPQLRPQVEIHRVEGQHLVTVEVPEVSRKVKPCYYKGKGMTGGAFIRVADSDRKMSEYEVQMLIAGRGQPKDDERPIPEATAGDLDADLVKGFIARLRRKPGGRLAGVTDEEVLRRCKVLVRHDGGWVPSVAGLLAFGTRPEDFLPALGPTFVSYPTTEIGREGSRGERFLDNPPPFHGPIPQAVPALLERIRKNMLQGATVRGIRRRDLWEYPETALREVIVNALAHRDLSEMSMGARVQVQMFPDRIVVVNPGGLFGPVTVDQLGEEGVSSARNATLMRILEDLFLPGEDAAICENRGSGIGAILAALRKAGMNPPVFEDTISTFRVSFSNASLLDEETIRWLERFKTAGLSDSQRMGLAILRHGNALDNATYRNATGVDSRVATQEMGDLVTKGLIVQHGTRRWATYGLSPSAQRAMEPQGTSVRRRRKDWRDDFRALLERRPLSRVELEKATGLSRQAVSHWLSILGREGNVEITTRHRRDPRVRYRWNRSGTAKTAGRKPEHEK